MKKRIARREFLGLGAAATALLPFIPQLEREVVAAGRTCKRLVIFNTPNGSILRNWRVEGLQHGDALPETLSEILQPLSPLRDKMIVLDGIDNVPTAWAALGIYAMLGKGHQGAGSIWTQWAPQPGGPAVCDNDQPCTWPEGPSLDQFAAARIGGQTPYAVINPNVYAYETERSFNCFYDPSGQPVIGENNPRVLFDRLFADLKLDPAEKERLKAEKLSVIDAVKGDLDSLKTRLGRGDKQRLEAHLHGVRALEQAVAGLDVICEIPPEPEDLPTRESDSFPAITDAQIDISVNALACDLTRVIGFKWGREGSCGAATWLDQHEGIHTISHWESGNGEADCVQWMTDLNRWFAQKFAELAQKLDEKGILDETLLVWSSTMGEGYSHNARNVPMVIVQGDGYFETNRYLKYGDFPSIVPEGQGPSNEDYGGESMNRFITSCCHAMGFDDVESFGDPEFGTGPLPGL